MFVGKYPYFTVFDNVSRPFNYNNHKFRDELLAGREAQARQYCVKRVDD